MMLPNGARAVVDLAKLRDYCLNSEHPRGRHKARVFASSLGVTVADAGWLQRQLIAAAAAKEAVATVSDAFGQRFVIDFDAQFRSRSASVRSCWIIRAGEEYPRLTSCFVR